MYTNNDGLDIGLRLGLDECTEEGSRVWIFDDCVVVEHVCNFTVYMETENGSIVRQEIEPMPTVEAHQSCVDDLNSGYAPTQGWDDGYGRHVSPANGETVPGEGGYSFEMCNGNCGNTRYFEYVWDAIYEAQSEWNRLSDSDKRRYSDRSKGGMFRVFDRDNYLIYDCVVNAKLAADRQYEADWARDDPEHLRNWFEGFRSRYGVPEEDSCIALFDGRWDGTEDPCELMREYDISCDKANAILDYLVMQGVEVELKEAEKEVDCDE